MKEKSISKEQIIKAAAELFAVYGLENVSVDEIAKKAGVAKGSIYNYFKTRDEILVEGAKYAAIERFDVLRIYLGKYTSAKKKLEALIAANDFIFKKNPELFSLNYSIMLGTHSNIKRKATSEFFKYYIDFVEEIIELGVKNKEFKTRNPRLTALNIILTIDIGLIFNSQDKSIISKKALLRDTLADLIC